MPLRGDLGSEISKGVSLADSVARAVWAALSGLPASDGRVPLVSAGPEPPHLLAAARRDVERRQLAVLRRVPFARKCGEDRGEAVVRVGPSIAAEGTASTLDARCNRCLPFMVMSAAPPHLPCGAGSDFSGGERVVLGRMPLSDQRRIAVDESIPLPRLVARAVRAARAVSAVQDSRPPLVTRCTLPPGVATGASHHDCWREGPVLRRVPFHGDLGEDFGE